MRALTIAAAALALAAGPAAGGLSLITEPQQGYAPLYRLLASPRHTLDLTIYELEDPHAEQLLAADARRGVRVRVLLDRDDVGSDNEPAFSYLQRRVVHVRWASTRVEITHEKSFVIDGQTAVIMTGNLTPQYYSSDRDFAVVDTGRADVAAIEQTFALDWANRPGTGPGGADLVWSPGSEQALVSLIGSARRTLLVENEELSDAAIVSALEGAARRGVRVELVMTRSSDWTDSFDALARAGVQARTYASSAPLYIHAKAIDADGARVFVGSENFSVASLVYNRELGLITTAPAIVASVRRTLTADFAGGQAWQA
jgi:phosphatidylserine/phosphatidylglycerophosphate/cardiolipin synthase-like enzyme